MSQQQSIESCQLIGFTGIIIQIILGALSFSVLIYKRYSEKPKRAWKIWAMDTSKQVVSQILAHIINVVISMQLSNKLQSDACIWYFATNVLDNTAGVLICLGVLSLVQRYLLEDKYNNFKSGNYYTILDSYEDERTLGGSRHIEQGSPYMMPLQITKKKTIYAISYFSWAIQFLIWNLIVIISKTLLYQLQILINGLIIAVSSFLIGWMKPYETLELIFVLILIPVVMNGIAFWFQDNFLKKKEPLLNPKQQRLSNQTTQGESSVEDNYKKIIEPQQILL